MIRDTVSLTEVKEYLKAHPEEFDMIDVAIPTECGTSLCICGVALHLAGYPLNVRDDGYALFDTGCHSNLDVGVQLLGLEGDDLFYHHNWPLENYIAYKNATTGAERVDAGIKAIDLYMEGEF